MQAIKRLILLANSRDLNQLFKGPAIEWWIAQLWATDRQNILSSLDNRFAAVRYRFQVPRAEALRLLKEKQCTDGDAMAGVQVPDTTMRLMRYAKESGALDRYSLFTRVHIALYPALRQIVAPPISHMSMDDYVTHVEETSRTHVDDLRDKAMMPLHVSFTVSLPKRNVSSTFLSQAGLLLSGYAHWSFARRWEILEMIQ